MNYLLIILAVIILIILWLIFKTVLKAFFHIFLTVFFIVSLVGGLFVYFVARDANDFKDKFVTSDNLFLLEDNGKLLSGLVVHQGGEPSILDDSQLAEDNSYYNNKELDKMLGANYKIFVVNINSFSSEGSIDYDGEQIERRFLLDVLMSDDPIGAYIDESVKNSVLNIDKQVLRQRMSVDGNTLKATYFYLLFANDIGNNPLNMIKGIKNRDIIVYPETMMFKVVKYLPLSLIESGGLLSQKVLKEGVTGMLVWLEKQ